MKEFIGTKVALINKHKVLMILRDNKSGINFPGMWDFPGGKREPSETPLEVATREINEELGIDIRNNEILWKGYFPATANPAETASFMAIGITNDQIDSIVFGNEGQEWKFMAFDEFFSDKNVVPGLKNRLRAYLSSITEHH